MDLAPPDLVRNRMPTFCRHNRLIQNCPICSREQDVEPRPLVSSSAPRSTSDATGRRSAPRDGGRARPRPRTPGRRGPAGRGSDGGGVIVRRPRTTVDDGYRSPLVPGLKSSQEAERLAEELAFAQARLDQLEHAPPGLYGEVADPAGDIEERAWLAFLIAYLGPLEGAEDPFAAIRRVRTTWASGQLPVLDEVPTGPRSAHGFASGLATLEAYRRWAQRAGSQAAAFGGEGGWTAERRFGRVFERLALPGLHRGARFDLLVTLGRTGVFELRAGQLAFGGSDEVAVAAKRAFGIADVMLLERRATQLAQAGGLSLESFDLGLYNWERGQRATAGMAPDLSPETAVLDVISDALGL